MSTARSGAAPDIQRGTVTTPGFVTGGYLLIALAAVLWALLGVFSQRLLNAGVSSTEIAFYRAALGGLLFVAHAGLPRQLRLQRRSDLLAFVGFALVGVTLFFTALNMAIDAGGVSLAFILLYTAPAFVAVLAAIFLGEKLKPVNLVLIALAITGVTLVARSGGGGMEVGVAAIVWGLVAGLSYSSYYLFGKWVLRRYQPATIYAVVLPVGALGLLPFVPFDAVRLATPALWLDIALMAGLSTYLAYLVYYLGLKRVEASRAVLVATVEPVVAAGLAALLFGERLGVLGVLGALLVLTAAVLTSMLPREVATTAQEP
ncbi:MAG: EamA family transporter [Trueperaceae bacterium]